MSTNNDPREFSLRKQLKLNHVVDILAVDDAEAANQENLVELQRTWLNLGHTLTHAENLYAFVTDHSEEVCSTFGDNPLCLGASLAMVCIPNPPRIACNMLRLGALFLSFEILAVMTIAYQAVSDLYEIRTLGELY